MSLPQVTVASWNIGGGILGKSHQRGGTPDIVYHAGMLNTYGPDIVCLQEAHCYRTTAINQVRELARLARYPFHYSIPLSASHLSDDAQLNLGVLSRYPIRDAVYRAFPNPGLHAVGPRGEIWSMHDKGALRVSISVESRTINVINGHCFPIHYFSASPTDPRIIPMWETLSDEMLVSSRANPTVACLDLNHEDIRKVLNDVLENAQFTLALPAGPTTPAGKQQDYILLDRRFEAIDYLVQSTAADHSYCSISARILRE